METLILFDLDGTLTDSGPGIIRCVQYALKKRRPEHAELTAMLHAVGYRGFVSVEMRRAPLDDVRRAIEDIAEVFA